MTQCEKNAASSFRHRLGYDTAAFLSSVFVVILSALCGYGLAFQLLSADMLSVSCTDPYAGCAGAAEYVLRAASLCRPVLIETAAVWLSAYVDFERPLLIAVFSLRGLSLGIALCAVVLSAERTVLAFFPLAYAAITAVFLILTRHLRRDVGRVPLSQSVVYALLAGGIASVITILATFFLS